MSTSLQCPGDAKNVTAYRRKLRELRNLRKQVGNKEQFNATRYDIEALALTIHTVKRYIYKELGINHVSYQSNQVKTPP